MDKNIVSLLELTKEIKVSLNNSFPLPVWVHAEISELRVNQNGHCYLELIEKDAANNQITARLKAMIWGYTFRMLKSFFETSTGQALSSGLLVLVQVSVEYHEAFGMSLIIKDIDPSFTVGKLQDQRAIVISRLQMEGVVNMNKELSLPLVPQRIAIISAPTAAGYGDFTSQLRSNPYGIRFYCKLFPALMQGEQSPPSVIAALDKIYEDLESFDIVVIIRGGGAASDLLCFDDYNLAYHITQFSLPVLSGIGHERDSTVADHVAHTSMETPTAVAGFLINGGKCFLERLESYARLLNVAGRDKIGAQKIVLNRFEKSVKPPVLTNLLGKRHLVLRQADRLSRMTFLLVNEQKKLLGQTVSKTKVLSQRQLSNGHQTTSKIHAGLIKACHSGFLRAREQLSLLDQRNKLNDPVVLLNRGFSITRLNGIILKERAGVKSGDVIETSFKDGAVCSKVISS